MCQNTRLIDNTPHSCHPPLPTAPPYMARPPLFHTAPPYNPHPFLGFNSLGAFLNFLFPYCTLNLSFICLHNSFKKSSIRSTRTLGGMTDRLNRPTNQSTNRQVDMSDYREVSLLIITSFASKSFNLCVFFTLQKKIK